MDQNSINIVWFLLMEIKTNAKKGCKQPYKKSSKRNAKHKSKDKKEEIKKDKKQQFDYDQEQINSIQKRSQRFLELLTN